MHPSAQCDSALLPSNSKSSLVAETACAMASEIERASRAKAGQVLPVRWHTVALYSCDFVFQIILRPPRVVGWILGQVGQHLAVRTCPDTPPEFRFQFRWQVS